VLFANTLLLSSSVLIIMKSHHFTYCNAHHTAQHPAGANFFNF